MSLHKLTCWEGPTWAYTVAYSAPASARRRKVEGQRGSRLLQLGRGCSGSPCMTRSATGMLLAEGWRESQLKSLPSSGKSPAVQELQHPAAPQICWRRLLWVWIEVSIFSHPTVPPAPAAAGAGPCFQLKGQQSKGLASENRIIFFFNLNTRSPAAFRGRYAFVSPSYVATIAASISVSLFFGSSNRVGERGFKSFIIPFLGQNFSASHLKCCCQPHRGTAMQASAHAERSASRRGFAHGSQWKSWIQIIGREEPVVLVLGPDIPLGHTQTQNTRQELPHSCQLYFSLRKQQNTHVKKKSQQDLCWALAQL